jgi:hypothetical protein
MLALGEAGEEALFALGEARICECLRALEDADLETAADRIVGRRVKALLGDLEDAYQAAWAAAWAAARAEPEVVAAQALAKRAERASVALGDALVRQPLPPPPCRYCATCPPSCRNYDPVAQAIGAFRRRVSIRSLFVLDKRGRTRTGTEPACVCRAPLALDLARGSASCARCGRTGDALAWAIHLAGDDPRTPGAVARHLRTLGHMAGGA